ncbi:hypothetical protein ABT158_03915 [Nonomuraea sp. NPDC001636]|uniref:hypothetical protein n=1 Tax=Nonomuraea sp. NPDC001636 TaxID=3154391 RepID=UPI0033177C52
MVRTNIFRLQGDDWVLNGWFDPDLADRFDEATRLVGLDCVSVLTADPAQHQTLYRTPENRWVLHRWSQWEGEADAYEFVDPPEARIWLLTCHHDAAVEEHFGPLPDEAGPNL